MISGTVYPILEIIKAYFLKKHLLLEYYSPILKYHAAALIFHGMLLLDASEKYKLHVTRQTFLDLIREI